jgi:hypothetical protein
MKNMQIFRMTVAPAVAAMLGGALVVHAQQSTAQPQLDEVRQETQTAQVAGLNLSIVEDGQGQEARQKVMLELVAADAQVVKGKQYSAETSTETVQTLSDGNRIVHHTVSKFYRDSEGRTRREETFGNVDPEHPTPHEVKVFIDDPVSGTAYVLDPGSKSAEKVQRSPTFLDYRKIEDEGSQTMAKVVRDKEEMGQAGPDRMMIKIRDEHNGDPNVITVRAMDDRRQVAKEDLGAKNIEGVDCTGTRQTITIPAGEMGNEKPIAIVTETWYSPVIEAVVQSTTDDPRYGKTTYQLTNVQTTEPARGMFEPPAEFKIEVRR